MLIPGNFGMFCFQSPYLFYFGASGITPNLGADFGDGWKPTESSGALSKAERDLGEELQGFFEFQGLTLPLFQC